MKPFLAKLNHDQQIKFEIFALAGTAILKFILIDWLNLRAMYIVLICLFWISYIYDRYKNDPSILSRWGIQKQNFRSTFLYILPFAVVCIAGFGIYGITAQTAIVNWHLIPILFAYPLWGLIQQFIVAGLIAGNLKGISNPRFKKYQIILITSLLFSIVHFPDGLLMVFTFIMQWIFTTAFLRWKNIWPLGLYHGWIATFLLFYIMGRDLWIELFVGF
jgi:membrane protease YdiL (CAAX protease family)